MTFRHKQRKHSLQFTIPGKTDNLKDPKGLHESNLHGK